MADIDIPFGSGDTGPVVRRTLRVGGLAVDLTGAQEVKFIYSRVTTIDESAPQLEIDCQVVNEPPGITPASGVVDFTWDGELAPRGGEVEFTGQYRAVLQSGAVMHFPNAKPLLSVVVTGEP